jgi:drug/metabolite transporter (DMT)-like permease
LTTHLSPSHPLGKELPLRAALFTIFLCILFGGNAVAIKISLSGLGVFTTIFLRFSIASLVLLLWAVWRGVPIMVSTRQFLQLSLISLIFFLQMSGIYLGQNLTTASHGVLIANLLPFIVMLLGHKFLLNERIEAKSVIGLSLGFIGVLLLFLDTINVADSALLGDFLIFMAIVLWGCNVILIKRIIADYHPVQITLFPMTLSAPLFLLAALLFDDKMVSDLSVPVIQALLYQALITASFGFIMWNTLIQKYGATALHSFIFVVPLSGVSLGIFLLNEPVTPNLIASIFLVTAALVVVNIRSRKQLR